MPKNEFWADPFLIKYKDEIYGFFENYEYNVSKGKISCAKIVGNEFVDVKDALNLPYHLSYPFVIEQDNEFYIIPETNENKRLEVYKCVEFPTK